MQIVLIGYRGCGKTTVGRILAQALGLAFVDTDVETCLRFGGATIADIWKEHGEPAYRKAECEAVAEVMGRGSQVVGLGGGTLMEGPARESVERAADTVRIYLKCEAAELHRRINSDKQSAATRPNLTNLGGGVEEVRLMLQKRGPVYEAVANKTVDVTQRSPEEAAREILSLLGKK